eukprot:PLAT7004.19.p1 GENE.PLAT7004.19~~PLAT7004.19.p1  ORF type:complete len:1050 (+),score=341.53 PLAT7004.19:205-3150(+)
MDFLGSLCFLLFILLFRRSVSYQVALTDDEHVTAADYAVRVTNLPKDATEAELRAHFDRLYALDRPDWSFQGFMCGFQRKVARLPTTIVDRGALIERGEDEPAVLQRRVKLQPVRNVDFTLNEDYLGSWCAGVFIAHPVGNAIRAYRGKSSLLQKLRHARGRVHMLREDSPRHDPELYAQAQNDVLLLEDKLQKQLKRVREAGMGDATVAAFVVFNQEESYIRCLVDYGRTTSWLQHAFYPPPLLFRGRHKLIVDDAPEPSDIVWENLETTALSRVLRRAVTMGATLLMLLASLGLLFIALSARVSFNAALPDNNLCTVELPAVAFDSYRFPSGAALRYDSGTSCDDGSRALFFANAPQTNVSGFACTQQGCPTARIDAACASRCVPLNSDILCPTLACYASGFDAAAGECRAFQLSSKLSCYCKAQTEEALARFGLISGLQVVLGENEGVCSQYGWQFLMAQLMTVGSSLAVVLINNLLRRLTRVLVKIEHHRSVSTRSSALAVKLLFSQFLNTAILLLVVNAKLPEAILPYVEWTGLFQGRFEDFTAEWYSSVGASLCVTVLMQIFVPHLPPLAQRHMLLPFRRWWKKRKICTQEQLNHAYTPPPFELALRYPEILNTVFVALFYSSGMPILLLLAAIAVFVTFWTDKYLLLRFYKRPPQYDETLSQVTAGILPSALAMHLAIACWMYGNNDVIKSLPLDVGLVTNVAGPQELSPAEVQAAYESYLNEVRSYDALGILPRVIRINVFPMFLLLLLAGSWFLLQETLLRLLRGCWGQLRGLVGDSKYLPISDKTAGPDRNWNPPFCGIYAQEMDPREHLTLSAAELADGWKLEDYGGKQLRFKVWKEDGVIAHVRHLTGQRKRTWEVMRDSQLHTYDIEMNPSYRRAIRARVRYGERNAWVEERRQRQRKLSVVAKIPTPIATTLRRLRMPAKERSGAARGAARGHARGRTRGAAHGRAREERGEMRRLARKRPARHRLA